jgi:hypothetical protein
LDGGVSIPIGPVVSLDGGVVVIVSGSVIDSGVDVAVGSGVGSGDGSGDGDCVSSSLVGLTRHRQELLL